MYDYDYEAERLELMYEQYQRDEQRKLLETETTPEQDAEALFHVQEMAADAEGDENYAHRCISGEKVFYYSYPKALIPGHIYSHKGRDEFYISRACEYHFDEWFADDEEDEDEATWDR